MEISCPQHYQIVNIGHCCDPVVVNVIKMTAQACTKDKENSSTSPSFGQCFSRLFHQSTKNDAKMNGKAEAEVEKCLKLAEWCVEKIEQADEGQLEGIYRKSGSVSATNALQKFFDNSETPSDDARADARSVADLFKRSIRNLTEPLVPSKIQAKLLKKSPDKIKETLEKLPKKNGIIAMILFRHLNSLLHREHSTKMSVDSLATVWAPNIFTTSLSVNKPESSVMTTAIAITKLLIENGDTYFVECDGPSTLSD